MVDFFYKILFPIGCSKICTLWNKMVSFILALFYPLYCILHPVKCDGIKKEYTQEIIVSLTSFPERINTVHVCINSLLRQTMKPSKIILWLSEEQFQTTCIPDKLRVLQKYGLSIEFCKEDIKPHKKTYYTFQKYPEAIVISVDDDIIYPESLVEGLMAAYIKYPNCVSCNLAHEIRLKNGIPDNYDNWNGGAIGLAGASYMFTAVGVGGVLYPPHIFKEKYFDIEKIRKIALYTDDLWLKYNEVDCGVKVNKALPNAKIPIEILSTQKNALTKTNNGITKRNDVTICLLENEFNINWSSISGER